MSSIERTDSDFKISVALVGTMGEVTIMLFSLLVVLEPATHSVKFPVQVTISQMEVNYFKYFCLTKVRVAKQARALQSKQKNISAPSKDSDQPRQPPSLIRAFVLRFKGNLAKDPNFLEADKTAKTLIRQGADAQAHLSSLGAYHFVNFVMLWLK